MQRILDGASVTCAESLHDLVQRLGADSFDLVIVGCHFDSSRALDAVRAARALAPRACLACIQAAPFESGLGEGTRNLLEAAVGELGVDAFVDLGKFPDTRPGNAYVRALLERLAYVH